MKFYAAETTEPVTLRNVSDSTQTREFPVGTKASATETEGRVGYHLNANGGGGTWDTWEGNVPKESVTIGEVIATCNEGA